MSSFKRRTSSKAVPTNSPQPDSNTLPIHTVDSTPIPPLLSGLSSIDDILGFNGLPTGQVLLVRAPDPHSAWGSMISRYSVAQGLVSGEVIAIVSSEDDADDLLDGCMWTSDAVTSPLDTEGEDPDVQPDESMKIAWRYAKMKQFSTTVPKRSGDQESAIFDLTLKIPAELIAHSRKIGQIINVPLPPSSTCDAVILHIRKLLRELNSVGGSTRRALRIIVPELGGPAWGDLQQTQVIRFLLALRGILRGTPAAAFVTLSSTISGDNWGGDGWEGKLSHVTDSCITLAGFGGTSYLTCESGRPSLNWGYSAGDPLSSMSFPNHHGLVKILSSPSHGTLRAPSISRSVLRGMSNSGPHGGGENNLAFRCTRRRLVIETMHLGAEGGVGARQTTAPTGSEDLDSSTTRAPAPAPALVPATAAASIVALPSESKPARVAIAFDDAGEIKAGTEVTPTSAGERAGQKKNTKTKERRVLFQSDKPEIYDF
ncbi:PAXNEB protein, partial [Rhizoctonia solani]